MQKTNKIQELKIHEANEKLIDLLEYFLKQAKSGELQGIVGIKLFDDGYTSSFWSNTPKQYHTKINSCRIIGELHILQAEMTQDHLNKAD